MDERDRTSLRLWVVLGAVLGVYLVVVVAAALLAESDLFGPGVSDYLRYVAWDASAPGRGFFRLVWSSDFSDPAAEPGVRVAWASAGALANAALVAMLAAVVRRRSRRNS